MALFQCFWHGDSLTPYEALCLRSFADCGHQVHLYSYNRDLLVPQGVTLVDAGQILPESSYFESDGPNASPSPSAFSNLFRWTLLSRLGGWWIDTDVVCLSSDLPEFELFFAEEAPGLIGCGVLFAPARHPLVKRCMEVAAKAEPPIPWGTTGPALITDAVKSLGFFGSVQPTHLCYPIHWTDALDVLVPEKESHVRERTASALLLHLWNQIFLLNAIDKFCLPPQGSYLRSIADRHRVEGWRSELSAELVSARAELFQTKRP